MGDRDVRQVQMVVDDRITSLGYSSTDDGANNVTELRLTMESGRTVAIDAGGSFLKFRTAKPAREIEDA